MEGAVSARYRPLDDKARYVEKCLEGHLVVVRQDHRHAASPEGLEEAHGPRGAAPGHQAEARVAQQTGHGLRRQKLRDGLPHQRHDAGPSAQIPHPGPDLPRLTDVRPELPREGGEQGALPQRPRRAVQPQHVAQPQEAGHDDVLEWVEGWVRGGIQRQVLARGLPAYLRLGREEDAQGRKLAPAGKEVSVVKREDVVPATCTRKVRKPNRQSLEGSADAVKLQDAGNLQAHCISGHKEEVRGLWVQCSEGRGTEEVMEAYIHAPLAVVAVSWALRQDPHPWHRLVVDKDPEWPSFKV
mmetsp:Transcript_104793/g.325671  ORF Transcript_104793/g.325671 Transcript_104793/m.325671 type:complete len:298 (+) Transcript_104793:500-1393(+)